MASGDRQDLFEGELHADRFKVRTLLQLAREGRLRVPPFQRPLRWRRTHELELFDSLVHRYPIGTLLLWSRPAEAGVVTFGSFTVEAPQQSDALWIVDGQQRLNTLIGALLHPRASAPDRTRGSEIGFDLVERRFVTCRGYVPSNIVPLNRLASPVDTSAWARERGVGDDLHDVAQRVCDALLNYEVPAYTTRAQDDAVLRKVFTRANTTGVGMRPEEVFSALNRPITGDATVYTPLQEVVARAGFGVVDDATLMKALIAVSGQSPRSARPTLDAADTMQGHVLPAAEALSRAIDLLRDEADIAHASLLPGELPIVVLTHFLHRFPSPHERTIELLVRWVWRAAVADRVSKTNEHLHRAYRSVRQGDEHTVVQDLLAQLPTSVPSLWPVSHVYTPGGRTSRIELCALMSLGPLVPAEGGWAPLNPPDLWDAQGPDEGAPPGPLRLSSGQRELDKSTAARLLAPPTLRALLSSAPDAVLISHALEPRDRAGLGKVVAADVLERRAARLRAIVEPFLRRRARWGEDGDVPAFEVAFAEAQEVA